MSQQLFDKTKQCPVCLNYFGIKVYQSGSVEQKEKFIKRTHCTRTCSAIGRERKKNELRGILK